jgi:hypothetical protein
VQRLSVNLYPRSFDHEAQLEAAAQYILAEFEAAGATVSVQDVVVEEASYKNIVARFGPRTGGRLVVGAHYDFHAHVSTAIDEPRGSSPATHTPGADDNASGVAGLIELAHLLGHQPPSRPIELVAYTLEEPPHFRTEHMGSAWHARSVAGEDVRLMLSLEMIGYFSDAPGSQRYPLPGLDLLYPDRGNFVALVGAMRDFGHMRKAKADGRRERPCRALDQRAALGPRRRLLRPPQLLGRGNPGDHGHRHCVLAERALPRRRRHLRQARLRAHDPGRAGRVRGHAGGVVND